MTASLLVLHDLALFQDLVLIGAQQPELVLDLELDLGRDVGVLGEEHLGVLAPLPELVVAVDEPCAGLAHDVVVDGDVEQAALLGDAGPVLDIELGLFEGSRRLVLYYLDPDAGPDDLGAVLERVDAPNVEPHRRVKLERAPAGGGLWTSELHTYFFAQLIDEDQDRLGPAHASGELSQRLAHQPRL